jgi:2-polyprenyl-6-methoxyphenol hydroxylase-like FAD-dependent oxidoreductase
MFTESPFVLVVGAGPTGLTLGIELARRAVAVRIVDALDAPFGGSRGDGLQPRTLEVFDDLGVLDAVLAAGMAPAPMRVHIGGRFVGLHRMSEPAEPTPAVPYPNLWMLGQSQIEGILRDRLTALGVRVEQGTALTGFAQDGAGVTATLVHDGVAEPVRADYLVGADGGRSTVRRTLGIPFDGTTDESVRMLLGDVRVEGLDHAYGHFFGAGPGVGVAFSPLPGGDLFQFGSPLGDRDAEPSLAGLQAQLDRFGADGVALTALTWSTIWRPNIRLARRFRDGRVFLAGDAAHVHPPTGGQGLNTGIQDAYNLGWKLAAGMPELLASYEAERRPVAARVLGISSALLQKYAEGAEDAHRRGAEFHQLDVGYRDSPIVHDARPDPGRLRAGDRAPDAPLVDAHGRPVRLFDLFRGPHATTLAFGATAPEPGETGHRVVRVPHGGALVDAAGHAFDAYDVADGATVVVRPDGYVGRIG